MISVGTKSETQAHKELQLTAEFLVEKGYVKPVELRFKTHNIVITADFGKSLNLEKFSETTKAIYEPEQFPGGNSSYRETLQDKHSGLHLWQSRHHRAERLNTNRTNNRETEGTHRFKPIIASCNDLSETRRFLGNWDTQKEFRDPAEKGKKLFP